MPLITVGRAAVPPPEETTAYRDMSLRAVAPLLVFALFCYCFAPYLSLGSRDVDPRIAEVWLTGGVGFVLLTTVWRTGRRIVGTTLLVMAAIFFLTAITMGYAPLAAGWLATTGVVQPLLMSHWYRRHLSHPGWAPESPLDIAALLLAAAWSSLIVGLVGGYPNLSPEDLPSKVLLWWVLRNTVFCFVAAMTVTVLFYGRRSSVLPPSPWVNRVGLLATALACVWGTYFDPSLPLSWLLIVPSVWGGLTLTVRGTAYLALTIALIAGSLSYLPKNQFGYAGILPAASIVDLLIIASTSFALLLALMREQRGSLIGELDRTGAESEAQRQILATVFESMKDGVLIVKSSEVTLFNAAARQMLGRPMPAGRPGSWVETFDLTDADGGLFDDDALRAGLDAGEPGSHARSMEVHVGKGDGERILSVSAQPLVTDGDRSTLVLLHDITAQRARLQELTNFAGMVAHDLRGPLTVLDGWLEVVQDQDAAYDEFVLGDVVGKAREAAKRMRQVIEDWLTYTVVQNGQLRPDAVKLEEAASDIVASRRARWVGGDEPRFLLELTHSVEADPGLLRQLFDNLVGNAIKYTAADQAPWVQLCSERDAEPGWIKVSVIDHGIGIPVGQEELIFEEFHRGPVEGRSAGTGLGLALTRRIVSLHGGQLSARRNPEGGSTFSFTLPEG